MKRISNFLRRGAYPIAGMLLMALLFSACKKSDSNYVRTPAAGLMAFNLAVDKGAVGFTLSGNNLTNLPLGYTSYTGAYLPVYIGSREVVSYDYNLNAPIAASTQVFADSLYYSLFTVGNNGKYRNVIVNDALDSLVAAPGNAYVRYINAIADSTASPLVTVGVGGANVISIPAPYASVSTFTKIAAGSINIGVNNESNINATRAITVEDGKIYTILLTGVPAATDTTKSVQIKYILNGTLTK